MCEPKQWTLMFYFATDNPLAISAISQLKAIKDAGFHPDANVVAQFDPYTEGTPTHVFDVNVVNKLKEHGKSNIGFRGNDPAVRSLIEDKLWRDEETSSAPPVTAGATTSNFELVRNALNRVLEARYHINYKPPVAPNVSSTFNPLNDRMEEPGAQTSLREFLRFCADKYPAKHYMLFMLGHGVVVGNDIFMLDENATEQSLTLTDLGKILAEFKHSIELEGSAFDLVSFHSCSVSSMEVAYELQGTAKYMLASQGPAFVGSWPYRQILVRIFNSLPDKSTAAGNGPLPEIKEAEMRELMFQIYRSCILNSADYLLAGYSFQLTLCDLDKVSTVKTAINNLAAALKAGIEQDPVTKNFRDPISADFILLSHWKSQSFFNEMYSDLYDFCFCLNNKISDLGTAGTRPNPVQSRIKAACIEVMKTLVKENPKNTARGDKKQFIVAADSLGPAFQYSRGLSVYFPWSEPSKDSPVLAQYQRYRFSTDTKNAWLEFLRDYFDKTKRAVSSKEPDPMRFLPLLPTNGTPPIDLGLEEDIASLIYNGEGTPDLSGALAAGLKSDPTDRTGGDISFISIKNFPRDTRARGERLQQGDSTFPITEAFGLFEPNGKLTQNGKTSPHSQNGQKNGSNTEAIVVSPKALG